MSDARVKLNPKIIMQIDSSWKLHKLPKEDILIKIDEVPELNEDGEPYSDNPGQLFRNTRFSMKEKNDRYDDLDLRYFGLSESGFDKLF